MDSAQVSLKAIAAVNESDPPRHETWKRVSLRNRTLGAGNCHLRRHHEPLWHVTLSLPATAPTGAKSNRLLFFEAAALESAVRMWLESFSAGSWSYLDLGGFSQERRHRLLSTLTVCSTHHKPGAKTQNLLGRITVVRVLDGDGDIDGPAIC